MSKEWKKSYLKGLQNNTCLDYILDNPSIPKGIIDIRKKAREEGEIADELEDLKDENGNPFTEKSSYYKCYNCHSWHGCGYVKGRPKMEWLTRLFKSFHPHCRICSQKIVPWKNRL